MFKLNYMNTNERTLKVLEWTTILEHLAAFATSMAGKERCVNAQIHSDAQTIKYELNNTTEAKFLLDRALNPPLGGIRNISDVVELARLNQSLRNTELIDIAKTIQTSRRIKNFLGGYSEVTPSLYGISQGLFEDKALEDEILNTFDEGGNILDSASPELKRLRVSLKDQTNNLKNKLNSLINSSVFSKYLQDPVYTQRDERYVVPVKVEHKAHVQGIVHDISSSGATLFIEPKAIVELNNTLREIELKIENEIKRILFELSQKIGEKAYEIQPSLKLLAEIDFIFAKARYSIKLHAVEPELNTEKHISLRSMKHPILMTVIENVVPNDMELGREANVLIITGSNTGGKTVALKTVGLFVLMTRAGLHVPALAANIYPFKRVFADIGDEQSVIQSLSTFSGHMTNIISVLNQVDNESLAIFDEIGAGTDPSEGSALAQAILEELYAKGSRTIVTTHYGELKALAYTKKGFQNASVEFDTETLSPTYKLLIGIPGKSNAITISKNLGLDETVVQQAQEIYLTQKDPTGAVLEGLQNTQQELTKNTREVISTREELERLEKEYNEKLEKLNAEKKKALTAYKKKFETGLNQAREEIKEVLNEVRRTKSEKIARRASSRLSELESGFRGEVYAENKEFEPVREEIKWDEIQPGDTVLVKDLNQSATLLSLPDKNKNVQIQIGMLKTAIKANRLAKAARQEKKVDGTAHKSYRDLKSRDFKLSRHDVSNTLDLRGARVEDGLDRLEKYLDDASLANLSPVYIIHGHGTGALKQAVREYLKTSPYVAKYRKGEDSEGGDGVSVVEIA